MERWREGEDEEEERLYIIFKRTCFMVTPSRRPVTFNI